MWSLWYILFLFTTLKNVKVILSSQDMKEAIGQIQSTGYNLLTLDIEDLNNTIKHLDLIKIFKTTTE